MHRLIASLSDLYQPDHASNPDPETEVYVVEVREAIDDLMACQADIQSALGLLRVERRFNGRTKISDSIMLGDIEKRLDKALGKAHAMLGSLGVEMPK